MESKGAKLIFLPSYSPDLNPIEQAFAKIKTMLQTTAARTIAGLHKAIARIIKTISPQECANYLARAGYAN
jgi:transposase